MINNEKVGPISISGTRYLTCLKFIDPSKVIHRESYHAFAVTTVRNLRRLAGQYITPSSVPGLKAFA